MRNARLFGITGLAVVAVAAVAVAQTVVNPLPEAAPAQTAPIAAAAPAADALAELAKTHWGDAQAGSTLAGACAACHGLDGNAMQQGAPRIAGMPERYVAHQLALFKSGHRNDGLAAVMKPFADALSAQGMRDVGAHYASQRSGAGVAVDSEITDPASPYRGMKFYQPGERLYRAGDAGRGIPACFACHGPNGAGNPGPAYPHVGGQDAAYVARRLKFYRAGQTSDPQPHLFKQMAGIAKSLTDEEIDSLATYLQGLHATADQASAEQVAAIKAAGTLPAAPVAPSAGQPVATATETAASATAPVAPAAAPTR